LRSRMTPPAAYLRSPPRRCHSSAASASAWAAARMASWRCDARHDLGCDRGVAGRQAMRVGLSTNAAAAFLLAERWAGLIAAHGDLVPRRSPPAALIVAALATLTASPGTTPSEGRAGAHQHRPRLYQSEKPWMSSSQSRADTSTIRRGMRSSPPCR
jgi:hypothetical protein